MQLLSDLSNKNIPNLAQTGLMSTQNIAGATADIVVFRTKDIDDDDLILMDSKNEDCEGHANDDFTSQCAQNNPLFLMSSLI